MVQSFANWMFRHGLIPNLNKTKHATRNTASANDHIITNSVINAEFKTGIMKTDISNNCLMSFAFLCILDSTKAREESLYKGNYKGNSIENFKQKLHEVNWNEVTLCNNANESYAKFSRYVLLCMKNVFPNSKIGSIKGKILALV